MRGWLALLAVAYLGCGAFAAPGSACKKHEDCSGLPRGYCSRAEICTRECNEKDTCPDHSTCSQQGGGPIPPLLQTHRVQGRPVCLHTCETTSDCLPNFSCSGSVCVLTSPLDPPPAT